MNFCWMVISSNSMLPYDFLECMIFFLESQYDMNCSFPWGWSFQMVRSITFANKNQCRFPWKLFDEDTNDGPINEYGAQIRKRIPNWKIHARTTLINVIYIDEYKFMYKYSLNEVLYIVFNVTEWAGTGVVVIAAAVVVVVTATITTLYRHKNKHIHHTYIHLCTSSTSPSINVN